MTDIQGASATKAASNPQQQQSAEWKLDIPVPIIAAGITVLGGLLIALLVNKWSGARERRTRFVAAATKFREAFAPDLVAVEYGDIGHLLLMDYLRTAHDQRHAAAVIAFEPFVTAKNSTAFRQAWQSYRYGQNEDGAPAAPCPEQMEHDDLYFLCYAEEGCSWETHLAASNTQKALKRMKKLLSYAEDA
jgi:hypothetical protein